MSEARVLVHDAGCKYARPSDGGHSDAAKRASDWWNLHVAQGGSAAYGHFIAIALADGSSDGTLYASRLAAVKYQKHNERRFMYLRLMPHGMTVCAAESLLYMHRLGANTGIEAPDRDAAGGGHTMIHRITGEEFAAQVKALAAGTYPLQRIG